MKNIRNYASMILATIRNNPLCLVGFALLAAFIVMNLLGNEASATMAIIVGGMTGGMHVTGEPLTTDRVREASPDLLMNDIDKQIVKIRPMATPIDQITRCAGAKKTDGNVIDYYSVDTKPTSTALIEDYTEPSSGAATQEHTRIILETLNDEMFDVSDTILVQGVHGYEEDGLTISDRELILYVVARDDDNGLRVQAVNGKKIGTVRGCVPSIDEGTSLIRMGRAATELDVMSPQFEAVPTKQQQYCQIFKMQVEESTINRDTAKKVPWTMDDMEEAAIYDMRLAMEKSFLFGAKAKLWDNTKKENVYLTQGIWYQAGKDYAYSSSNELTQQTIVNLMRQAFTGNAGSKRKILIGGSGLIGRINKLDYSLVVSAGDTVTQWGIDFTELRSKFGTLYVLLSEVFDDCGMEDNGLVIDPAYIQKFTHIPFTVESLDLKASGVRNVNATVFTESSAIVLRYPKAHMRITRL